MTTLLFRTLIIYLILTVTMRLMGKRQLGELQVSELISALLLSEVAAIPISDPNLPLSYALLPVLFVFLLEILIPCLFFRLPKLRRLIEGTPSILIENGIIRQSELRRNRITPEEFYSILRANGVQTPSDVSYAILEASGAISIFLYAKRQPPVCSDLRPQIEPSEPGINHILVSDGRIQKESLRRLSMTADDLSKLLEGQKVALSEVFLLTINGCGELELIRKETSR